ncbi:FAD-dependent oxidoreductase [Halorarum salinum]|uniref:FAD-dependent oxidoreductase n=1 Tax=Halorarum salinum TaxID=2743089 RepID=A0A7D5QLN7_9EURY|nr:FAD-dependent oxidoreductase [Halobaculum salinum]QLG62905.1 FAD-dependent oxidoreductase [Halobaculum salinum]
MTDVTTDDATADCDVLVAGGGVSGLTAATYTARAGLRTLVVSGEESILRRNAHLENFPGFPAGVNPRLFADMLRDQAGRNGAELVGGTVEDLAGTEGEFVATLSDGRTVTAARVVAASWSDADYLDGLGVEIRDAGSKRYVAVDGVGRTSVAGVYVAGRLAEKYHQAVVAAGHGAEAGITLVHDAEVPYYHDWVAPEGYFTDRGREVPPGCEEIDAGERDHREAESRETMREYFAEPHDQRQRTHPSLVDDERGRVDADWEGDDG